MIAFFASLASLRFLVNKTASVLSTSKVTQFCRPHFMAYCPACCSILVTSRIELLLATSPISSENDRELIGSSASISSKKPLI